MYRDTTFSDRKYPPIQATAAGSKSQKVAIAAPSVPGWNGKK